MHVRKKRCDEVSRVMNSGGIMIRGRVGGQLAVSRTLGDHHLKTSGVSENPSICERQVPPEGVLVIASDGIWDVVEQADLLQFRGKNSIDIADELLKKAIARGTQDNACIIAVSL